MAKSLVVKTETKKPDKPEKVFKEYCKLYPWAVECKEYEV